MDCLGISSILSVLGGGENGEVLESYQQLFLLGEILHVQCQAHLSDFFVSDCLNFFPSLTYTRTLFHY